MTSSDAELVPQPTNFSAVEEQLQPQWKNRVKSQMFLGYYQEKRYVEGLKSYRDIVVVSNSEQQLQSTLTDIKIQIKSFYPDTWISWVDYQTNGGYCVWTDLGEIPFGEYWFQVKTIRFRSNEVCLKIKMIRPSGNTQSKVKPEPWNRTTFDIGDVASSWRQLVKEWKESLSNALLQMCSMRVNRENIGAFIRFIALLAISLVTGSIQAIKFIGIFSIRLMAESRMILIAATPIILKIIDVLSKIVGGFYILLAMMWRDLVPKKQNKNDRSIEYKPRRWKALPPIPSDNYN